MTIFPCWTLLRIRHSALGGSADRELPMDTGLCVIPHFVAREWSDSNVDDIQDEVQCNSHFRVVELEEDQAPIATLLLLRVKVLLDGFFVFMSGCLSFLLFKIVCAHNKTRRMSRAELDAAWW